MVTREAGEYHPYAVCLMFKTCHDGEIVRANLDAVMVMRYYEQHDPRAKAAKVAFEEYKQGYIAGWRAAMKQKEKT